MTKKAVSQLRTRIEKYERLIAATKRPAGTCRRPSRIRVTRPRSAALWKRPTRE